MSENRSNLGVWERLGTLAHESRFNDAFVSRVLRLEELGFDGWRRVRGDGNCFYRAVGFGLLEAIATAEPPKREQWGRTFLGQLEAVIPSDHSGLWAAAHTELQEGVRGLATTGRWAGGSGSPWGSLSVDGARGHCDAAPGLLEAFRPDGSAADAALVRAMRHLAARGLTLNASDPQASGAGICFEDIIIAMGEHASLDDFCKRVVLSEGVEAQHVVLNALAAELGVALRVAMLDRTADSIEVPFCDYDGDPCGRGLSSCGARGQIPAVHLQFRPGHYDLLYKTEQPHAP